MAAPIPKYFWVTFMLFLLILDVVTFSLNPIPRAKKWLCELQGECCDGDWISPNFKNLTDVLKQKVYGQHLILKPTMGSLRGHWGSAQSKRPLSLSFHGRTGTGKNYVTELLVQNIYKKGMRSRFVHTFSANHHFPHDSKLEEYKDIIRKTVVDAAKDCPRSLFIFDEMDQMPPRLLDTIVPYLECRELDGTDYSKTTFIFISNDGGSAVTKVALDHWMSGGQREELTLEQLEEVITERAFNQGGGGWWHSALLDRHLISAFIPFLPLEKRHVRECVKDELKYRSRTCDPTLEDCSVYQQCSDEFVDKIADSLTYIPQNISLYSTSGCKRISDKVNHALLGFD